MWSFALNVYLSMICLNPHVKQKTNLLIKLQRRMSKPTLFVVIFDHDILDYKLYVILSSGLSVKPIISKSMS